LAAAPDQVFKLDGARVKRQILEAVISTRHPLLGLSIRDSGFRNRYNAVVIAVARAGERVAGRIGDIILQPGDVLLLEAPQDFIQSQRNRTDFILVSNVDGAHPPRFDHAGIASGIMVSLIAIMAFGWLPPITAAFLAAGGMVLTRCCTLVEARQALDLSVLVTIAAAFGLGSAVEHTGLNQWIAEQIISMGLSSPWMALICIYGLTFLFTELITNSAAAVLTVPIAIALAVDLNVDPTPFIIAIMIAASASFLTPVGYQTNLMVMNPGGYLPRDYMKLGWPLSLMVATISIIAIPQIWPFV
jgi:di/tricarboxylate transporter